MTIRVGNVVLIEGEDEQKCQLCGVMEECRPAGPRGEQVCYDCAQKNPAALQRYTDRLFGRVPIQ